jgi:tetrapyrrole methylase family protein / MazG family protein
MTQSGITLLGLGPGDPSLITRQAWNELLDCSDLYLRTRRHSAVKGLPAAIKLHDFDALDRPGGSFETRRSRIVEEIISLGGRPQGVVYAVPGHPLIGDAISLEIYRRAAGLGIPVQVIAGISLIEPVFSILGLAPLSHFTVMDALELATFHVPPFSTSAPAVITQMHSPAIAAGIQQTLLSLYPTNHVVWLVNSLSVPQQDRAGPRSDTSATSPQSEALPLSEIHQSDHLDLFTSLYLPALGPATSFEAFQEIIAHLRAPDGCPWDREQTHQTLRTHLLEETYEVLAALDADNPAEMREEFGDLLLQVVLHAQIAAEVGEFTMADVLEHIHTKIVRRHPHVFGDLELKDAQGVLRNWERLKAEERIANGKAEASLLDGVASALPALLQAEQYQRRAAHVGFDWPDVQGVLDKLDEELQEVRAARNPEELFSEIGDLLSAVVNLARWYKVEPESALREANRRFRDRFSYIEQQARLQGRSIADLSLDEMEAFWQVAKLRQQGGDL